MRRLPPLKALHAFEAAARHESVTKAAQELKVSHSAVSQQIKILEEYFGQKLFTKKGNGLELMPKARNYLKDIRQSLDLIAVASENLSSSNILNRVRVNATPTFTTQWLIPKAAVFQRANPKVEVRIETSVTDELHHEDGNNDLTIRRYPMMKSGMECVRLLDDETIAVIAPSLLGDRTIVNPTEFLEFGLLHIKSRISAWPRWFQKAGIRANQTLRGQVFDHILMGLTAARNGAGVSLVPKVFVEEELRLGQLVQLCPEVILMGSGFFALYDKQNRSVRNIERLVECLSRPAAAKLPETHDIEWEFDL